MYMAMKVIMQVQWEKVIVLRINFMKVLKNI